MAAPTILQPPGWPAPRGYSNGIVASGRLVFVAGQIGWNERGELASKNLVAQFEQALRNCVTVVTTGGGTAEHIVRLTIYVVDREDYRTQTKAIGAAYRNVMGAHYPVMALLEVKGLLEREALVEIEATAVIP